MTHAHHIASELLRRSYRAHVNPDSLKIASLECRCPDNWKDSLQVEYIKIAAPNSSISSNIELDQKGLVTKLRTVLHILDFGVILVIIPYLET